MTERNDHEAAQHGQEDTPAYDLPFGLTPAHVMAAVSFPLCIGTYAGYKRQLKIVQKEAAQHATEGEAFTITRESKLVARRALGLGTLLSLSGFGILTSGELKSKRYIYMRKLSNLWYISLYYCVSCLLCERMSILARSR
jgi:hypothetical protein